MKNFLKLLLISILLTSCGVFSDVNKKSSYAKYYIVILDTSLNYYDIHNKMFAISNDFGIPIDTLGRFYDKEKDLIILPEDDLDEIYAGVYFIRRELSSYLSLEYLNYYKRNGDNKTKTIALIAGIYKTKLEADSVLTIIKSHEKNGFKIKSKVYIGCAH